MTHPNIRSVPSSDKPSYGEEFDSVNLDHIWDIQQAGTHNRWTLSPSSAVSSGGASIITLGMTLL